MSRRVVLAAGAGLALLLATAWWQAGDAGLLPARWGFAPGAQADGGGVRLAAGPARSPAAASPAGALQGPGVAAQEDRDPFLVAGLRHRLEQLLLEAGPADSPEALKDRLLALVDQHFGPAERTRALALAGRYVDYRVAVGKLAPPRDMADPHALREALAARQAARRRHFSDEEWQALFAAEEELDRFTIARVEIARNAGLTAAQKQAALRAAEAELPPAERAARADSLVHEAVAAQTRAFDAAGVPEAQRWTERRALHGEAAADRLGALDREERDWAARLDRYAAATAATQDPAQLASLREQLFTPQEQLRIDAALAVRAPPQR